MTVDSRVDNPAHWGDMHPFFFCRTGFWVLVVYSTKGEVRGGACWLVRGKGRKGKGNVPPLVSFIMVRGGGGFAGWWYVTGLSAVLHHMSVGSCYGWIEWKLKGCFEKN